MPACLSAGSRYPLISLPNGSTLVMSAADFTPFAFSIAVSSLPMRSGMAAVVNQMFPGLRSLTFTEAAVFPTIGNRRRSSTGATAMCIGVPQGASSRSTLSSVMSFS